MGLFSPKNLFNLFKRPINKKRNPPEQKYSEDLVNINSFFYVIISISLATVGWYTGFNSTSATPLLWCLACFTIGAAFGFLFGIPKILQSDKLSSDNTDKTHSDYRMQVNTNLTEISDWLTKIIVGLGLIQLSKISFYLNKAAYTLAQNMNISNPDKDKAFALALILCFSILGFLFGYLSTRLFLQGAFSRADQEASSAIQTQLTLLKDKQDLVTSLDTKQVGVLSAEDKPGIMTISDIKEANTITDQNMNMNMEAAPPDRLPGIDPMVEINNLAKDYLNIWVADNNERLRLKTESSKKMFDFVVKNNISKNKIMEEADKSGNQGIILTLANMIFAYPENGDDERLLRVAYRVDRWHIQYRIVQALGQLIDKSFASSANYESINNILNRFEKTGDQSLINLIKGTRTIINRKLS
jgi:hypothetical protein